MCHLSTTHIGMSPGSFLVWAENPLLQEEFCKGTNPNSGHEKSWVSPRSRKQPPNGSGVALHEETLIRGRGLPSPSLAPIRRAWWEHLATGTALGPWMLLDIAAGLGATAGSTHPSYCSALGAAMAWWHLWHHCAGGVQPFNYTSTQNRSAVGNTLGSW